MRLRLRDVLGSDEVGWQAVANPLPCKVRLRWENSHEVAHVGVPYRGSLSFVCFPPFSPDHLTTNRATTPSIASGLTPLFVSPPQLLFSSTALRLAATASLIAASLQSSRLSRLNLLSTFRSRHSQSFTIAASLSSFASHGSLSGLRLIWLLPPSLKTHR